VPDSSPFQHKLPVSPYALFPHTSFIKQHAPLRMFRNVCPGHGPCQKHKTASGGLFEQG
jgi:hypothetical protein